MIYFRNAVKLQLYTHFTNVLYFTVVTSSVFMLYFIKTQRLSDCGGVSNSNSHYNVISHSNIFNISRTGRNNG